MKFVYASRTGNVESIVQALASSDTLRIVSGSESVNSDFVLFTYTDGYGDVPSEVESFLLANSPYLKAVVVSGDTGYGEAYCAAGDKIAAMYGVDCIAKIENDGTPAELDALSEKLAAL